MDNTISYKAVVIGASAGGLSALKKVLSPLPATFNLPVIVVQHRPPQPDDRFTQILKTVCNLPVKEADDKEPIKNGVIYFAPANYHLLVERDKTLSLSIDIKINYARPAIDILFQTAADAYLTNLIGIILTGANQDGTAGLKQIQKRGGLTIAQSPATAEVDTMPRSAVEANVIDKILSLNQIAQFLVKETI